MLFIFWYILDKEVKRNMTGVLEKNGEVLGVKIYAFQSSKWMTRTKKMITFATVFIKRLIK